MQLFRRRRELVESGPPAKSLPESGERSGLLALPRLIRRLVGRELCPGEKVARIGRPEAPDDATIRRQLVWWVLGAPVTLLVFGAEYWQAVAWLSACWLGPQTIHYLVHRWRHRCTVYVATNQRCFELSVIGWRCRVRDVSHALEARHLPAAEIEPFAAHIRELQQSVESSPREHDARAALAMMPRGTQAAVSEALISGEEVVWVARPTFLDYFRLAPLDLATFGMACSAGGLTIVAAVLATARGNSDPVGTPLLALGFGGASLAGWLALAAEVRRRVVNTVYALTDRRGLVIGPRGRVREYSMGELRRFHRTQAVDGGGNLAPAGQAAGFLAVRDVKVLDDLVKGRDTPDRSTELAPAEAQPGRGDELSAPHSADGVLVPRDFATGLAPRRRRRRRITPR